MKRSILTILAAALIAAAPAWAQQTGSSQSGNQEERTNPSSQSVAEDSGLTITGQVTEVTETSLSLQTMTGTETIVLTPETEGSPSSLKAGDQVSVDVTRNSQGVMVAEEVRMGTQGSASAGSTAGTTGSMSDQHATGHHSTTGSTTGATGSATGTTGSSDMTRSTATGTAGTTTGSTAGSTYGSGSTTGSATGSAYGSATGATGTTGSTASSFDDEAESDTDMAAAGQDSTTGAYTGTGETLPRTASETPLVALLGVLALVAAAGLRAWVR